MHRLKQLRKRKGWSQAELARRAGISQPYIVMMESGARKNPSLKMLGKLAKALGVDVTALLRRG
jgi:transcriptional regulator with XRE-family HTH domain